MPLEKNMYFKNLTESLGTVPRYFINDILDLENLINTGEDGRAVLGRSNQIQPFPKIDSQLQRPVTQLGAYILSQQYPILKHMVVHESLLITLPNTSDIVMPTRYLCRIGELLVIPLKGSCEVLSDEFAGRIDELKVGQVYRINNRINSRFNPSHDFLCAAFNYLDHDLKRYLMPHDLISPFVRRKDEYFDPVSAPDNIEVPKDAY